MKSRFSLGTACGLLVVVTTATLLAHTDDPKARYTEPRVEGPSYRSALGGVAGDEFDFENVDLLARVGLPELGASEANDCWGYVAPSGREYAIIGLGDATGFVEVTNPGDPQVVAVLPGLSSTWQDIKVFQDHAYSVSEAGGGVRVFDMSAIDGGTVTFVGSFTAGDGNTSTHNVAVNTESGYLYRTGGGSGIGLQIYDLNADPANPQFVGSYHARYVHDACIVNWPDGREIAFCCAGTGGGGGNTGLQILDVSDKENILELGHHEYAGAAYSHQGWISPDFDYFYLDDELDENSFGHTTKSRVIDVSNFDSFATVQVVGEFTSGLPSIDHNMYVDGDFIYQANYSSGLRVFDRSGDPTAPVEVAYFDTYPPNDAVNFSGLWSCFPFFPSGTIIGSDRSRGLFVWQLDFSAPLIAVELPDGAPDVLDPDGTVVSVQITELEPGGLEPGTALLHYDSGGGFVDVELVPAGAAGGDLYNAVFPPFDCDTSVDWYVSAQDTQGEIVAVPGNAPAATFTAFAVASIELALQDDMEVDNGWAVANSPDLTDGAWDRGVPVGGGDRGDPPTDFDGSGQCWLTDNEDGNSDVDGGTTTLTSPALDASGEGIAYISYARWYSNNTGDGPNTDSMPVEISANGADWILVEDVTENAGAWVFKSFRIDQLVEPGSTVQIRFTAGDGEPGSIVEAGIDDLRIEIHQCPDGGIREDVDGDGDVDVDDLVAVILAWGGCPPEPDPCDADVDGDGDVDVDDLVAVILAWTG